MAISATLPCPDTPGGPAELIADALDAIKRVSAFAESPLTADEAAVLAIGAQQVQAAATCAAAVSVGVADAERSCDLEDYRTTSSFVADRCRIPTAIPKRHVSVARKLRKLPLIAAAYRDGSISTAHIDALLRLYTPKLADDFTEAEAMLLGFALTMDFPEFIKNLRYWEICADPDGTLSDAEKGHTNRSFNLSVVGDMAYGNLTTDVITGTAAKAAVDKLAQELFEQDWAEAKARLGRTPTAADLPRTPAQRRHDAHMLIFERGLANTPGGTPEPHFHIVMDKDTFDTQAAAHFAGDEPPKPDGTGAWFGKMRSETIDGYPIHPAYAIRHLTHATINRVVFETKSCVLDYGRSKRFFTGALRQALIVRDQTCQGKGCDIPATKCHIDHITPWSKGGKTSEHNGGPKCLPCNLHKSDKDPPQSGSP